MSRAVRVLAIALVCACNEGVTPTPSPSPVPLPIAGTPLPDVSPGVLPSDVRELAATSAPVPSAPPPSTPTPTPDPAVWRFEGRVVDADGKALRGVCVAIGPHGCQRGSPRTDERGVYFFDVPQIPTVLYDLYFVKPGYAVVWYPVKPDAPTVFNVVLHPRP